MKTLRFLSVLFVMTLVFNVFIAGCDIIKNEDGTTTMRMDPNAADSIEKGGEAAVDISKTLAPLLGPAGGVVAGGLASALALFKKYKPKLVQEQTKAEMSNTVAGISVDVFETIKKEYPEVWEKYADKIRSELQSANVDTKTLENFIRGLRGLPSKA